jgi:hypothetical protein
MEVVVEQPEEMPLLGLFMHAALKERADALERAAPKGELAISAGGMSITLSCSPGRVVVRPGAAGRPAAHMRGSLEGLVEVARGRLAGPLLRRRIRVSGNPLALLPLARVFREAR